MDGRPVGGRIGVHEMYGVNHGGCLPSMGVHLIHGWGGSMSGMQHIYTQQTYCPPENA